MRRWAASRSRPITEEEAQQSVAVLVLEPGTGLDGKLKTARKGVGDYHGHGAREGVARGRGLPGGASAILELARQIDRIAGFTELERGMTVNPGVDLRRHADQRGGGRGACRSRYPRRAAEGRAGAGTQVPRR